MRKPTLKMHYEALLITRGHLHLFSIMIDGINASWQACDPNLLIGYLPYCIVYFKLELSHRAMSDHTCLPPYPLLNLQIKGHSHLRCSVWSASKNHLLDTVMDLSGPSSI